MTNFKPGDRVRRVNGQWGPEMVPGVEAVVTEVIEDGCGGSLNLEGFPLTYAADCFELVTPAPSEPVTGDLRVYLDGSWRKMDEGWEAFLQAKAELDELKIKFENLQQYNQELFENVDTMVSAELHRNDELDEFKAKVVEAVEFYAHSSTHKDIFDALGLAPPTPSRYRVTFEVEAESGEEALMAACREAPSARVGQHGVAVEKIEEE